LGMVSDREGPRKIWGHTVPSEGNGPGIPFSNRVLLAENLPAASPELNKTPLMRLQFWRPFQPSLEFAT
jgi:hypothetical protein